VLSLGEDRAQGGLGARGGGKADLDKPTQEAVDVSNENRSVIEFMTKSSSTLKVRIQPFDEPIISGFVNMSGSGSMAIVDETLAFDIIDGGSDPRSIGRPHEGARHPTHPEGDGRESRGSSRSTREGSEPPPLSRRLLVACNL
jgi:hypothetical protein